MAEERVVGRARMKTVKLLLFEAPPEDALVIAKETASSSLGSDLSTFGPVECGVEPDRVRGQWNADSILPVDTPLCEKPPSHTE
jgi:hypothetical protein